MKSVPLKFPDYLKSAGWYLEYLLNSKNEHSVHSPFLFNLLTKGIYLKNPDPIFDTIEKIRQQLLHNKNEIQILDLGAGSKFEDNSEKKTISFICKRFSKSPKLCKTLYRITAHLKPSNMIELGTSLGLSTMYQAAGNPEGVITTIEGCHATAAVAAANIERSGIRNINLLTGAFDALLPQLLERTKRVDYVYIDGNHTYDATIRYFKMIKPYVNKKTLIVFDDINWSEGMRKAWSEIKSDTDVTLTADFYFLGLIFFNKDYSKEDFVLRL